MYYLGIDLGSSSVKIALVAAETGVQKLVVQEPEEEMPMIALHKGWAEQNPEDWWNYVCKGIKKILSQSGCDPKTILGIGIAYQMHGLVLIDKEGAVLRNSIIWCDSRAVAIGEQAYGGIGKETCKNHLLNAPGNFTASKLKWVQENEPAVYSQIYKCMLPGDFIAFRLSQQASTTVSGLSEGIFWDFKEQDISTAILDHYGFDRSLFPDLVTPFGVQGKVTAMGSEASGLAKGTPILYRAGDQPNNALALNVFNAGEVAATGGTSGVMYAISNTLKTNVYDRINNFAHVNHGLQDSTSIGKLVCINGAGIQYRWLLNNLSVSSYDTMNKMAQSVPVGSDDLVLLPFGNGAERLLGNKNLGARMLHIDLNRHDQGHLCRAALEGIAFAFVYGFELLKEDDVVPKVIRAGNDNLFRSQLFSNTIASLLMEPIAIHNTTGAVGAARACTIAANGLEHFAGFTKNDHLETFEPQKNTEAYTLAYMRWKKELNKQLNNEI